MKGRPHSLIRRMVIYLSLGVLAVVSACSKQEEVSIVETPRYSFECTLKTEATYVIGQPVNLLFSLHNLTAETLYVLTWYTPLEGLAGEILRVTLDGEEVPYRGILAKRGDPLRDEYIAIAPGATASAVVDLAEDYDLSQAGQYHVEFTSRLYDVTDDGASIPRKRDDHQMQELPCNVVSFEIVP